MKKKKKSKDSEYRYELRKISDSDYNSHADVSFWYFTNGFRSPTSPAGHSDKRRFPSGTVVLCRLKKGADEKGKKGWFMQAFAKVVKFSKVGRPIGFDNSLSNEALLGYWKPPSRNEVVYDARTKRTKKIA